MKFRTTPASVVIGWVLATERKKRGLPQSEVSKVVGLGQSAISRYENGDFELSVTRAVRWATHLDIDLMAHVGEASRVLGRKKIFIDWTIREGTAPPELVRAVLDEARIEAEPSPG